MTELKTYMADDGTVFDTKEECLEYEKMKTQCPGVLCFSSINNGTCKLLDPNDVGIQDAFVDSQFIVITNPENAAETIPFVRDYVGIEMPEGPFHAGEVFEYDDDRDHYYSMQMQIAALGETLKTVLEAASKVLPDDISEC